ncbi:MAG TPA: ABC transporter permease [Pseudonocardiaceae bacterium]|nr:ABC transporter permease [Pseudonocardiaceae bacterium]
MLLDVVGWFADAGNWAGSDGMLLRLGEHLWITLRVVLVACLVAVPLGLAVGHTGCGGVGLVGLANAMRALPTLGLVTFLFLLYPSGELSTLIALVVLAVPPVLAGTYAGVQSIEPQVLDAARGMGMTGLQRLVQAELPGSLPLLVGGVRSAVLQVVATTVVAAYVGVGGLGDPLLVGLAIRDYTQVVAVAILTAALAVMLDLLLAAVQRMVVPRGLRLARAPAWAT